MKRKPFKAPEPKVKCKCGKTLSQKTRANYPFGKKSKAILTKFYKCNACGFRSN